MIELEFLQSNKNEKHSILFLIPHLYVTVCTNNIILIFSADWDTHIL